MIEGMLITAEQTLVLFIIMLFGSFGRWRGYLDEPAVRKLTALVVNFTTPCIILLAFQRPFDAASLPGLGWSALIAAVWYAMGIVAGRACFGGAASENRSLRWAVMFSNCGFMGLPLAYAIFGPVGVFYTAVPITFFNLLGWTYGVSIFRPFNGRADLLRGLFNPANVASMVGLALYFLPWRLPEIIVKPMTFIGDMNTPLPMLILGYYLIGAKFFRVLTSGKCLLMLFLRHLAIPLLLVAGMCACPFIPLQFKLIAVVPAAAPTGVLLTVFAVEFGGDAEYSTAVVAVSTVLSILTIPVVFGIAKAVLA